MLLVWQGGLWESTTVQGVAVGAPTFCTSGLYAGIYPRPVCFLGDGHLNFWHISIDVALSTKGTNYTLKASGGDFLANRRPDRPVLEKYEQLKREGKKTHMAFLD